MRVGSGIHDAGFSPPAAGFDLRAIDQRRIARLASDSRQVRRGDTFVAYPGESQDGRRYIAQALARGDAVVIAGKEHERHQEIGGVRHPFSDEIVARAALAGRRT